MAFARVSQPRRPRVRRHLFVATCMVAAGVAGRALPWLGVDRSPGAVAQPPLRLASSPAVSFLSPSVVPAGGGPVGETTADLNRDGVQDLVAADHGVAAISVSLGRGDGTFRSPVSYAVGSCPIGVAVGSLRGNGILDVVTANNCSGNFSVLLGNGDGTFQPAVSYATTGSAWGIALADFNKDGKLDVVVSEDGTQSVAVLFGNGDGTLQAPSYYTGGHGGENGVAVGDFNGDGYPDIVAADGGPPGADPATVSVFINTGAGTFGPATHDNIGNTYAISHSVVVGDLNRDNKLDIVVVNGGCGFNNWSHLR